MLTNLLKDEFEKASEITGKKYRDIVDYYTLCKRHPEILHATSKSEDNILYTQIDWEENIALTEGLILSYTRDYIWFDEKLI